MRKDFARLYWIAAGVGLSTGAAFSDIVPWYSVCVFGIALATWHSMFFAFSDKNNGQHAEEGK